jgi:hypothetical protein
MRTAPWTTPLDAIGTVTYSRSVPSVSEWRLPSERVPLTAAAISGRLVKSTPSAVGVSESRRAARPVDDDDAPAGVGAVGGQDGVDRRVDALLERVLGQAGDHGGVLLHVAQQLVALAGREDLPERDHEHEQRDDGQGEVAGQQPSSHPIIRPAGDSLEGRPIIGSPWCPGHRVSRPGRLLGGLGRPGESSTGHLEGLGHPAQPSYVGFECPAHPGERSFGRLEAVADAADGGDPLGVAELAPQRGHVHVEGLGGLLVSHTRSMMSSWVRTVPGRSPHASRSYAGQVHFGARRAPGAARSICNGEVLRPVRRMRGEPAGLRRCATSGNPNGLTR